MNNKSQIQIGAGILTIIIFMILIFYILPQFKQPKEVNYQIQLENNKIASFTNAKLFFKITNGLNEQINNVKLNFEIIDINIKGTINIRSLKPEENYLDNIEIPTRNLNRGSYTIRTTLEYDSKSGHKEIPLQLGFEIS